MQIRTRDPDGGVLMFNGGSEEGRFSLLEVTRMLEVTRNGRNAIKWMLI